MVTASGAQCPAAEGEEEAGDRRHAAGRAEETGRGSAIPTGGINAAAAQGLWEDKPLREEVQGRRDGRGLCMLRDVAAGRRAVTPGCRKCLKLQAIMKP